MKEGYADGAWAVMRGEVALVAAAPGDKPGTLSFGPSGRDRNGP
jgi:hypothetical protein